jgi:hypothetical protein
VRRRGRAAGRPAERPARGLGRLALCILAALTVGPLGAAIVGLCAMLGDTRRPYLRWFSYVGVYLASGVAAGFAARSVAALDPSREVGDYAAQAVLAAVAPSWSTSSATRSSPSSAACDRSGST